MACDADQPRYVPISDYALIGDCHGVALVRRDGSIDWACLTRFDAGGVFCRLLDAERGGSFALSVRDLASTRRRYLPDTNVLETTFITETGRARLLDCFAMRKGGRERPLKQLLRLIECEQGHVEITVEITPRFDYGGLHPWLRFHPAEGVHSAVGGDDAIVVTAECPLSLDRDQAKWRATLHLRGGESRRFTLTAANPFALELDAVPAHVFDARLEETVRWWRSWMAMARSRTEALPDEVARSALVLKLLTCAPTGAILAAPTTSLPEVKGGSRNWDYRYSWIRDSTMTLSALLSVGHREAAIGFRHFIRTATAGRAEELQVAYGCYGERRLEELEVAHLEGYAGSRPVRVGNAAAKQLQLDVYGELLDAAHLWLEVDPRISDDDWLFLRALVESVAERWQEPDRGLWETRGEARHFVYSKAMCWLAFVRGLEIAERFDLPCDRARWCAARERIREEIETRGVDPKRGCFVQAYGSLEMDASLLRLPLIGFVAADDPRMIATVEAIRSQLAEGPLVHRYRAKQTKDGLRGTEGAFLMASFWLVQVLSMAGRGDEASALYRSLLSVGNDLGLYSEERDPRSGAALGNFPQAFTHVALIAAWEQLRRAHST